MTQEQKDLLLKDLCARLPYKTAVSVCGIPFHWDYKKFIDNQRHFKPYLNDILRGDVKPYLFPLSSMTEEQRKEYESLCIKETSECADLSGFFYTRDYYYDTVESIDYLCKNHIDIRGLIPMGLALDATGLNIY